MSETNRSYSLIETPEQEAIARLLCNIARLPCNNDDYSTRMVKYSEYIGGPVTPILMCRHNRWDVGFVANGQSGPGERIPFPDLLLQCLGADGVQAVRALAKVLDIYDHCKGCDDQYDMGFQDGEKVGRTRRDD